MYRLGSLGSSLWFLRGAANGTEHCMCTCAYRSTDRSAHTPCRRALSRCPRARRRGFIQLSGKSRARLVVQGLSGGGRAAAVTRDEGASGVFAKYSLLITLRVTTRNAARGSESGERSTTSFGSAGGTVLGFLGALSIDGLDERGSSKPLTSVGTVLCYRRPRFSCCSTHR